MDDTKGSPRTVKVVDRRKFTPDGDPREEEKAPPESPSVESPRERAVEQPNADAEASPHDQQPSAEPKPTTTSPLFIELVNSLAQNAAVMLAGTEELPANPNEAKRLIDYLGMLEEKTAGNLSADEKGFLEEIVFQLRTAFLNNS